MLKATAQDPHVRCEGFFCVSGGRNVLARTLARLARLPRPDGAVLVSLDIDRGPGGERWTRRFGTRRIVSHVIPGDHNYVERIGPLRFCFRLEHDGTTLRFVQSGAALALGHFTLPLPRAVAPTVTAAERHVSGGKHVAVEVAVPWLGTILAYEGRVTECRR